MLMMILPARASPYLLTTGTALSNSTARMTMSPAGAAPHVPAVAPLPSVLARAAALAASRPMTSTALPPLTARAPMALAMFPEPMMLMPLMNYPVLVDDRKVDTQPYAEMVDASTNRGSMEADGTELAEPA
jgi:hypothetical protein